MNKLWLKITGIAVLILVAIILLYAFWPAETWTQDEDKGDWDVQPNPEYPEAEKLYQRALAHKEQLDPRDDRGYIIVVDCCQRILRQYPGSPQAEKARELLQQYNITEQEMSLLYPSKPRVRKSRSLRRRVPRMPPELYYIPDEEVNSPK